MAYLTPAVQFNSFIHLISVPMGLAIVGGTLVSTILTLFVVPAIYLILTRFERSESAAQRIRLTDLK